MSNATYKVTYGDNNTGYSHAHVTLGSRGGAKVFGHDGNPRRVTQRAIASAVRQFVSGEPVSIVTTAQDEIPAQVKKL